MAVIAAPLLLVVTGRNRPEVEEASASEVIKAAALNASDEFFTRHGCAAAGFAGAQDLKL